MPLARKWNVETGTFVDLIGIDAESQPTALATDTGAEFMRGNRFRISLDASPDRRLLSATYRAGFHEEQGLLIDPSTTDGSKVWASYSKGPGRLEFDLSSNKIKILIGGPSGAYGLSVVTQGGQTGELLTGRRRRLRLLMELC